MYCTHCGAKIDDNARFCPECGKSVAGEPASQRELAPLRQPSSSQPRVPEYTPEPTSTRRKNTSFKKPQFKKEGSGEGSKVFFKILAAAIVVLVAYLGYDYFANGVGGGDEVVKKTSKPYFHLNEDDKDTNQASSTGTKASGSFNFTREELADLSPSSPSLIGIHMTRSEIESVAPITAKVSPENPTCQVGGITVKFNSFDLDDEDTFQLRQLGTRYDQVTKSVFTLFDFSLASGKHVFSGNVTISIPRAQNGGANGIYYYNEEAKAWEYTSYEISDDGKNYILYTNHFTTYGELDESEQKLVYELEILKDQEKQKKAMGENPQEIRRQIVVLQSDIETIRRVRQEMKEEEILQRQGFYFIENSDYYDRKKYLLAPLKIHHDRFLQHMTLAKNFEVMAMGFLTEDDKDDLLLEEGSSLYATGYSYLGNINSGITVLHDLPGEYIRNINEKLGKGLSFVAAYSLFHKIAKTLASDRSGADKLIKIVKDGHGDFLSMPNFSDPISWILACYSLLADYLWSIDTYEPADDFDALYHYFMETGFTQSGVELEINGFGWQQLLENIGTGLLDNGGTIGDVKTAFESEFQKFVSYYWEVSKDVRDKSYVSYQDYFPATIRWRKRTMLNPPAMVTDPTEVAAYKARALMRLKYAAASAISTACKSLPSIMVEKMEAEYNNKIVPFKNSILRFRVRNKKLLEEGSFEMSPYASGKIHFNGLQDVVVYPIGTSQSDYTKKLFTPESVNDDVVFICRRYVYEMYGMPKTITFEGINGMKPITLKVKDPMTVGSAVYIDLVEEEQSEEEKETEAKQKNATKNESNNSSSAVKTTTSAKKSFEIPSEFSASSVSGSHEEYGHKMNFSISGGYINPKEIVDDGPNDKIRRYDAYIKVGQTISVKAVNTQGYEDTGMEKWNSARCFMEVDGVGEGFMINEESGAKLPSASGSYVVQKGDRKIKASAHTGTEKWHPMGGVGVGIHVEVRYKVVE